MKQKILLFVVLTLVAGSAFAKKKKKRHKHSEPTLKQVVVADLGVSFASSFGKRNYESIRWGLRHEREPVWYQQLIKGALILIGAAAYVARDERSHV